MSPYKALVIILLLIFTAGMAKGVSDTLQFHYEKSVFANIQNEQWWNPDISWKNKYRDYDNGDTREAYLGSRTLFVWLTDAWHLAQTIETLGWVLALLAIIRFGYLSIRNSWKTIGTFFVLSLLAFYSGFMLLYGWLLVI
jgi:hypothetical protein